MARFLNYALYLAEDSGILSAPESDVSDIYERLVSGYEILTG